MGAYVTVIGPSDAQVEYRLTGDCGCGTDAQVDYYLTAAERPMRWVGRGAAGLGLPAGGVLDAGQHDAARAVMRGVHPVTGKRLVAPKTAVAPAALLPAAPLVDAVVLAAIGRGVSVEGLWATQGAAAEWGRLVRGVRGRGTAYRISVTRAARLLDAAGITPEAAYDRAVFDTAARHAGDRVVVGNRGYDLTLTLPKSFSVLAAFADPATAARLESILARAGEETLAYAEDVAGYGLRGRHGGGRAARRVPGRGLVGWVTVHRAARPVVDGLPGDPHLHAHYTIANLVQGADGRWSTVAAGGRDLLAHVRVFGEFVTARVRRLSTEELGLAWERDEVSGQWEIAGIGREAITVFSQRGMQVDRLLAELGLTPQAATPVQHRIAAQATRRPKNPATIGMPDTGLRGRWRARAVEAGLDPDRLVAAVRHAAQTRTAPARPGVDGLAGAVFDPDCGVTSRDADFTRRDMLAALADTVPDGLGGAGDLEALTDRVLASPDAVGLPARPGVPGHLSNTARYTTRDLVDASDRILAAASAGLHTGAGVVPAQVADAARWSCERDRGYRLSAEQRAVFDRLVGAGNGVEVVVGVAGSGKTTVVAAARRAWAEAGLTVRGTAVAAIGAENLRQAGIPATTLAGLLHTDRPPADVLAEVDVLVVDEASQIGVRDLDALLTAAARAGTKVVQIGDPRQLGSPAPGGALAAQHRAVAGLTLTDNRRQRDPVARRAAGLWRDQHYRDALDAWQATGGIVATLTRTEALRATLSGWDADRAGYPDRYDRADRVLLLATRTGDVAALNAAGRALARARGDLTGPDQDYPLATGGHLRLAVGDLVMTRVNDYRVWRDAGPDVLNGRRGYVDHLDPHTGQAVVTWRAAGTLHRATLSAEYITAGGLDHGYAMTVYKAQGQTTDVVHTYGAGLDAHTTYVAQTRARHHATVYLPLAELADPTEHTPDDLAALPGDARTDLAISALAEAAERTREEHLITDELTTPTPDRRGVPDSSRSGGSHRQLAGLDPGLRDRLRADPALPALLDRLDHAATAGHDPTGLLATLAAGRDLHTSTSAAKVLHWRLTRWLDSHDHLTEPATDVGPWASPAAPAPTGAAGRLHIARATATAPTEPATAGTRARRDPAGTEPEPLTTDPIEPA